MPDTRETICITCGQGLGDVPRLHRLSDGSPCPACRERLLETLPPLLPASSPQESPAAVDAGEQEQGEADFAGEREESGQPPGREPGPGGRASGED